MVHRHIAPLKAGLAIILAACALGVPIATAIAQGDSIRLTQTAEYNLGVDCPVAAALDPAGSTLWVLVDDCFQYGYVLHAYDIATGTRVNVDDHRAALSALDGVFIDHFIMPLGFTPAGDLSIRYYDSDGAHSKNLLIPPASGGEAVVQTSATFDALLAAYSDYPEFSVYSPDHRRVVAFGAASLHILDVEAETEIAQIPVEGGTDYVYASFSADGERLYVIRINDPDSATDLSSTLLIYSLPDGELLRQHALPSSAVWLSPDETRAAVQLFSTNIGEQSDLIIMALDSGLTSAASSLLEDPTPVISCLNDGRNVSGLGYVSSGYLSLSSLDWLPDGSGLVLTLSAMGEGSQSASSFCSFNYSRLRTYTVSGAGN